ncbi:23S rRNA (guanosine(2251)-2'-O)-methyltransferase RlmB [Corynebacterium sp. 320]|uniref:23S rRNA (guanosine(2251)-2'-O)-methyltransferase RlmB n=1 Tax=Corynebacterium TaxID=1716 RepID=UPI00125CB842|nr:MULTISPECIES: 23S rRNA (guanosine(2251)-2'-O)-methyltransferase RlmB [Corynebacterium]KAB1503032.1 23S rRNA (guanosine(2251)-2'-O)-methyltransferase RlmB [Corynebacterium sp. 320]KAB1550759.1 23S rRNA (guanosine(2251)-2'-O)-methyltransferase RlmB [Corynebacterium sp. 321]KAB1551116.1 23S rRNA (guanosine(2251)-2'-O)-methyltransferase RlmB [Corynebacterium sp. 319]KAB3526829.1 23S rRNA (guanosine(2251)-2'-O)-methyltransferase RlmB [Corynebacterium sp. 250]KAB3538322.1 23S rRNA (guanosine(2251
MAGNSQRQGAVRKSNKKGSAKGSGGQRRRGLRGKGATPKAEDRVYHAAYKKKRAAQRRASGAHDRRRGGVEEQMELVVGRNPVVECLHAKVPATALYVAEGSKSDQRLAEAVHTCADRGIAVLEVSRQELDRMTGNGMHQGIGLQIPPFDYAEVEDLIEKAATAPTPGMIVALDNITDPRNLGAVIRSVAAFGGHGVVIPERRSASVTAVAWRTSAGTAARLPVAKATNMVRSLKQFQQAGYQIVGLDAGGEHTLDTYDGTTPVVIVVGSEGKGMSRLVRETCDSIMSIPMAPWVESLNASVAAGVVLSEFARQRRAPSARR